MAAAFHFSQLGWPMATAQLAALAMHPLDDSVRPSRRYEKAVRKLARTTSRSFKGLSAAAADSAARSALATYKALAAEMGEAHYESRFDAALALETELDRT